MRSNRCRTVLATIAAFLVPVAATAAEAKTAPAKLSAERIVQMHIDARGGSKAWHDVQSMVWSGKMDVGYGDSTARSARYVSSAMARKGKGPRTPTATDGKDDARKQVQVPFVLEIKRPDRSRVEIEFAGKTAVQVYDGTNGWLLRPFLNRDDWEPFTAEQAKSQQGRWDLDGPLIDHAAKGTKVELVSVEPVEGRDSYKLKLTHRGGEVQHVWVDAKSFLDVKVEGAPRWMDGKKRAVWVIQRDFRSVQGVKVPFVQETVVEGYSDTHKLLIDKVALNLQVDDARFTRPRT